MYTHVKLIILKKLRQTEPWNFMKNHFFSHSYFYFEMIVNTFYYDLMVECTPVFGKKLENLNFALSIIMPCGPLVAMLDMTVF